MFYTYLVVSSVDNLDGKESFTQWLKFDLDDTGKIKSSEEVGNNTFIAPALFLYLFTTPNEKRYYCLQNFFFGRCYERFSNAHSIFNPDGWFTAGEQCLHSEWEKVLSKRIPYL